MVIPAELLQVGYAAELRRFLVGRFSRLTLVTFRHLVFPVQQEVVLLLGEKNGKERSGIRVVELDGIEQLQSYRQPKFSNDDLKPMDHSTEKWTQYFLTSEEVAVLRRVKDHPELRRVKDFADVEVGIVTGFNDFFILDAEEVRERSLDGFTIPVVSRSPHLGGIVFSETEWETNRRENRPSHLLDIPDVPTDKLPREVQDYIAYAEKQGWHKGYKCSIRDPWYVVPSVWTPDAFMLRQIGRYPKVVVNDTEATCTDTIHRVRFHNGTNRRDFASVFLNSLTFAFSEVMGRSYGGGVLELEPREAASLPLPPLASSLDAKTLNRQIIAGSIEDVLDATDEVLLRQGMGLTREDTRALRGIWAKLRDRRNSRH